MNRPNFFILGAPKCGTTSLAAYLSEHPQICMSIPKETFFFCDDVYQVINNIEDYFNCFQHKNNCIAIGEASAAYLYSKNAVLNILKFNPDAKFIVMLRNPIEMVYSWHSEIIYNDFEDETDFQKAWELQESRKSGKNIPSNCEFPGYLQYTEVCSLGEQLERLFNIVSRENVHIIFFDDMKHNVKQVYEDTLKFLNVPSDNRDTFPVLNKNKQVPSKVLKNCVKNFDNFLFFIKMKLKFRGGTGISKKLYGLLRKNVQRPPLSNEMKYKLKIAFEKDIHKLSTLTDRDLSDWLKI